MALGAVQKQRAAPMQLTRILTRPPQLNASTHSLPLHASAPLIAFVMNVFLQPERVRILTICGCLQPHLLQALYCMAQASPIAVIGEAIWGDEVGTVYVLQVEVFSDARVCSPVTAQRVHPSHAAADAAQRAAARRQPRRLSVICAAHAPVAHRFFK